MHFFKHDERDDCGRCEERCDDYHHDPDWNVLVETSEGRDPTTVSPVMKSCSLEHMDSKLTNIDEEEHEEPEGTVAPEGPVQRSVPTDKGAGSEEQEPQDAQPKVNCSRGINTKPGQASEDVQKQGHRMEHP